MAYPTVRPNDPLDQPSHSGLHNQHATDLEALQQTTADLTDLTVTLAGGNAGEVLGKSTNDDYDWEWIPAPTGGDGGDTYPGISTEQPNGLGIGTDGGLQVDPATLLSEADGQSITLDSEGKIYGTVPEVGPVGKVLQVVRATDPNNSVTNNSDWEDAGISVTITPTKSTSAVLVIWSGLGAPTNGSNIYQKMVITDSSNNSLIGAGAQCGISGDVAETRQSFTLIAYDTPATTSATTYKLRYAARSGSSARLLNSDQTGQMYAIEVSA